MNTIRRIKTFRGETVIIDECDYEDCTFIEVRLMFSGIHFGLKSPRFQKCTWVLTGAALPTAQFLKFLATIDPEGKVELGTSGIIPDGEAA